MSTITLSELPASRIELGQGKLGAVYRLDDFDLPGYDGPVVYKQFHSALTNLADISALRELIEIRRLMAPAEREAIDNQFAWPLCEVQDDGKRATVGLLMPLLPERFFVDRTRRGKTTRMEAKLDLLFCDAEKTLRGGAPCPANGDRLTRLRLCESVARAFSLLHGHGLVYGDFSHNNALYSLGSDPMIFLIDCDAVRSAGGLTGQANTFSWLTPEVKQGTARQNSATDCYKLALFILRCLTPGGSGPQKEDPAEIGSALDGRGRAMLARTLGTDPISRPSSAEWVDYLAEFIDVLLSPPTIDEFSLDDRVILSGAEVTATWRLRNAERATLTWPDGFEAVIDRDTEIGSMSRPVSAEGFLTLRCANKHGERQVNSPMVLIVQLPRMVKVSVPEPVGAGLNGVHGGGRGVPPSWISIRLPEVCDIRSLPRPQVPALPPVPRLPPVPAGTAPLITVPPLLINFGQFDASLGRQSTRVPARRSAFTWLRRLVERP